VLLDQSSAARKDGRSRGEIRGRERSNWSTGSRAKLFFFFEVKVGPNSIPRQHSAQPDGPKLNVALNHTARPVLNLPACCCSPPTARPTRTTSTRRNGRTRRRERHRRCVLAPAIGAWRPERSRPASPPDGRIDELARSGRKLAEVAGITASSGALLLSAARCRDAAAVCHGRDLART